MIARSPQMVVKNKEIPLKSLNYSGFAQLNPGVIHVVLFQSTKGRFLTCQDDGVTIEDKNMARGPRKGPWDRVGSSQETHAPLKLTYKVIPY